MSVTMDNWKRMISSEMTLREDSWDNVVYNTMSEVEMDILFNSGYGSENGIPFTLWTKDRVYFPVCYDGAEWVSSVPRNPCKNPTKHIGGG